jgi:RNA polymerase sigma factor
MLLLSLNFFKKHKQGEDSVRNIIDRIKEGDLLLKEKFISDYKPFILQSVSKLTGSYVDIEKSEEFSVGLLAFDEALRCFDRSKNRNFLSFSSQVINRRVIDYIRINSKNKNVLPFTYFENDENNSFEEKYLAVDSCEKLYNIEIEEEIYLFKEELKRFGISLLDLAYCAPKHKDSKQLCIRVARLIAENRDLYERFIKTKNIPMTDLLKVANVYHGTIERNRKFIIAMSLIINSRMDILKGYVKDV